LGSEKTFADETDRRMTVMKKSRKICQKIWIKSCLMIVLAIVLPAGGAWSQRPDQGTAMAAAPDLMAPVISQTAATRMALEENPDIDTDLKNDTSDVDTGMKNDTTDVDTGMKDDTTDVDTGMKDDTTDVDKGMKDDTSDVDTGMKNDPGDVDTDMQEMN
jgi:hypothetical protein